MRSYAMTWAEVNPAAWLHVRLLIWVLLAVTTWPPSRAFGIFTGHPLDFGKLDTKSEDRRRYYKSNWEPSFLWWRNKRSFQEPGTFSPSSPVSDPGTYRDVPRGISWPQKGHMGPQNNEVLQSEKFMGHPSHLKSKAMRYLAQLPNLKNEETVAMSKLLVKLKKMEEIRNALRRRHKILKAEREEARLEALGTSSLTHKMVDDLKAMLELNKEKAMIRRNQNMKSRRGKMELFSKHSPLAGRPAQGNGFPTLVKSNIQSPKMPESRFSPASPGQPSTFKSYGPHISPQPGREGFSEIEWFPNPADKGHSSPSSSFGDYRLPSATQGSFSSQPIHGFSQPISSESSFSYPDKYSPSGGFSDVPLNDSPGSDAQSGSFFMPGGESNSGFRPVIQQDKLVMGGVWEDGGFDDNDKDCDDIFTKTCLVDSDCLCHGFYTCRQGSCQSKSDIQQPADGGMWHEKPIDFGLTKRDVAQHKMAEALRQEQADQAAETTQQKLTN